MIRNSDRKLWSKNDRNRDKIENGNELRIKAHFWKRKRFESH